MKSFVSVAILPLAVQAVRIVQSNDDGWAESYIRTFNDALNSAGYDVVLSAPAENKSGSSSRDEKPKDRTTACQYDSCPANSGPVGHDPKRPDLNWVNSFPVTSMKYGIDTFGPSLWDGDAPELAVTGPNVGTNLWLQVPFSGTVGAACYAAHEEGIPAIAFSGASTGNTAFNTSPVPKRSLVYAELATTLVKKIVDSGKPYLPEDVYLNVNFGKVEGKCTDASQFQWVLTRINTGLLSQRDTEWCGEDRLPTETEIALKSGCYASISVGDAADKTTADAARQKVVLGKLKDMLAHLKRFSNLDFLRYPSITIKGRSARALNYPLTMAPIDRCLASMARLSLLQTPRPAIPTIPKFLAPAAAQQVRQASVVRIKKTGKKKKALPKDFKRHNLAKREFPQYSLCEAMRILRAVEVGQPPASVKYEIHINLKTARNGPVIKNSVRLPHPVQSDWRIAVICPEGSEIAQQATAAGAVAVGQETLFEAIKKEQINFDRLICHEASEAALNKAGLGKILGPKGLMPSKRMRTIVPDVVKSMRDSAGAADYRERQGVIRMAIGQLGYSPDQLKNNIKVLLTKVKAECAEISEEVHKEVHEVILSTTHGPGISLNGKLKDAEEQITPEALSSIM
ncbi:ribosomal L1 [Fusarium mundagurra]|uniref:Ribosomal L1 n=1 Tax=Fusarium mundagurra TaxID=1567541 RepID=A0A8H5YQ43_9HYPO|nr:ribosomal L1 [Fusarium mundagurra]